MFEAVEGLVAEHAELEHAARATRDPRRPAPRASSSTSATPS